jgi:hypothetical protein
MRCTTKDNLVLLLNRPIIRLAHGSQSSVLYFDKQQDTLLFTLAANAVMSSDAGVQQQGSG